MVRQNINSIQHMWISDHINDIALANLRLPIDPYRNTIIIYKPPFWVLDMILRSERRGEFKKHLMDRLIYRLKVHISLGLTDSIHFASFFGIVGTTLGVFWASREMVYCSFFLLILFCDWFILNCICMFWNILELIYIVLFCVLLFYLLKIYSIYLFFSDSILEWMIFQYQTL